VLCSAGSDSHLYRDSGQADLLLLRLAAEAVAPASALQRVAAEALGTLLLLAVAVGSGIMGERLAGGNVAIALLANTAATVAGLYALIEVFAPISGAHFNPVVSLVMTVRGELPRSLFLPYVVAQLAGAVLGAWLAHAMFDVDIFQLSSTVRAGTGQWLAEVVATFGLLLVVLRVPTGRVSSAVALYIGAAYWFTASTSFANPAAALGRMFSDTFTGIAPASVAGFVIAEFAGGLVALLAARAFEQR
jgi:glycerol uptake facilitator-like aquaporin